MSSFHSDDFDSNWNYTSSSFQDLLLKNVNQVESNAYISHETTDIRYKKKQKKCNNDNGFQVYRDEPALPPIYKNDTTDFTRRSLSDNTNILHKDNEKHNIVTKGINMEPTIDENFQKMLSTQQRNEQYDDDIWLEFEDINIPEELINAGDREESIKVTESSIKDQVEAQLTTSLEWIDNNLQQFGGFKTAGSKKDIKPSDMALKLANENAFCLLSSQSSQPLSSFTSLSQNIYQKKLIPLSKEPITGFTTSHGAHLNEPSIEARKRANDLFFSDLTVSPQHQSGSEIKELISINSKHTNCQNINTESTLKPSELAQFEHDSLIGKYGGFFKASGKKEMQVSETAKAQALKFFQVDEPEKSINNDSSNNIAVTDSFAQLFHEKNLSDATKGSSALELNDQESSNIVTQKDNMHNNLLLTTCSINNGKSQQHQYKDNIEKTPSSKGLNLSSKITSTNQLQQRKNRALIRQYKIKPFKSPAIDLNLVRTGLEKSNSSNSVSISSHSNETKRLSVFNINPIGCRRPLYTLGKLKKYTNTELISMGIPREIVYSTPVTSRSLYIKANWNVENAKEEILKRGTLKNLIPKGWVEHHFGWIVWKLARRICMFPQFMNDWWQPDYIINQLLYRYEREINLGHRSVLKKIMEHDDIPAKHMVLMVADIISATNSNDTSSNNAVHRYQLLLTDGWYAILASIDKRMEEVIKNEKLCIGHKISIIGAQLIGDKSPIQALDSMFIDFEKMTIRTSVRLLISSNSCCRCPWYTNLGYRPNYRRNRPKRTLETIHEDGGLVTMLDVIICKKYPMVYMETLDNGMIKTRNAREEESIRWKIQSTKQRQVSSYFRLRLCDVPNQNMTINSTVIATLLVPQATEIMYMDLVEGQCYRIYFLQPYKPKNNKYYGKLHLKTSFQTKWEPLPQLQSLNTLEYPLRTITTCASIIDNSNSNKMLMDMDIVVYVLCKLN
ncbi:unnamed protein product [Cunninghamella echinulata]